MLTNVLKYEAVKSSTWLAQLSASQTGLETNSVSLTVKQWTVNAVGELWWLQLY